MQLGLQRNHAIQVPRGLRQAIQIGRDAFLLVPGATQWALMTSNLTLRMQTQRNLYISRYSVFI